MHQLCAPAESVSQDLLKVQRRKAFTAKHAKFAKLFSVFLVSLAVFAVQMFCLAFI
jgi:hypothetical protein